MSNTADIAVLYVRELRSALRERNIVINSILVPIFLYPLLLWLVYTGISFVGGQTEGFSSRVMLKDVPARHLKIRTELEHDDRILLRTSADPLKEIRAGDLDLLVEFLPPPSGGAALDSNFSVRLSYDNSSDRSELAHTRVSEKLTQYRDDLVTAESARIGLRPEKLRQFYIESQNVASSREMSQFILGLMLPMFLVIMLAVGSMVPAIDSTAGEREKSTWETLMTLATPRSNIVIAKYLYVATMGCVAGLLNLAAMVFSMKAVLSPLVGGDVQELSFTVPLSAIPVILLVTALLSLFVSAGMMILASFARTYKEGQSLVTPFYIATFLPVMFLQIPGLELTPVMAVIPVVNVAMVFREALSGIFRWPLIGLTALVELVLIGLALWIAVSILRYEDFLMGSYGGKLSQFVKEKLLGKTRRVGGLR